MFFVHQTIQCYFVYSLEMVFKSLPCHWLRLVRVIDSFFVSNVKDLCYHWTVSVFAYLGFLSPESRGALMTSKYSAWTRCSIDLFRYDRLLCSTWNTCWLHDSPFVQKWEHRSDQISWTHGISSVRWQRSKEMYSDDIDRMSRVNVYLWTRWLSLSTSLILGSFSWYFSFWILSFG